MSRSVTRSALVATLVIAIACAGEGSTSAVAGTAGLTTIFDSSGDTIVARVDGDVPARYVRSLTDEMRIAPSIDDTSLFTNITNFVVDRAGRFWVYDNPTQSIFLFEPDGKLVRRIGQRGGGPGEFFSNNGMVALPDTGLAIWDSRNTRISFFSSSGDFRTSWRTPAGFYTFDALFADRDGTLRLKHPVAKATDEEVIGRMGLVRPSSDGAFADSVAPPHLHVPTVQYTAVYPGGGGRASYGAPNSPQFLWAWHPDGWFVASNSGSGEIVLARSSGKPVVFRRSFPPVPVPDEERSIQAARLTKALRQVQPDWTLPDPLPSTKPPFQFLSVSRDGRIWVQVATPSERVPDNELPPSRDSTPPTPRFRSALVYEIYAADGRFLGRVAFPRNSTLMQADHDTVWLIERDADDLPAVVRARITPGLADSPPPDRR